MAHTCLGCHKKLKSNRSYSGHIATCQAYQIRRRNGLRASENTEIDTVPTNEEDIIEPPPAAPLNMPETPCSPPAQAVELPVHNAVSLIF
jgi:hypothetical protein